MGMPVEEDIAAFQGRRALWVVVVAVGCEDCLAVKLKETIVGEDGKLKYHLVNFCVAVPADAEKLLLHGIEHGDDFFGIVILRKIVSGTVVQDIAQKEKTVCVLFLECADHFPAVIRRAVDIRCDH